MCLRQGVGLDDLSRSLPILFLYDSVPLPRVAEGLATAGLELDLQRPWFRALGKKPCLLFSKLPIPELLA